MRLPDLARLRRAVLWATPGQLDAGFASLATFITGIAAVRALSTEALAAYALLTSAYRVVNQFPARLVFSPSEIIAIDSPVSWRLGSLAHSIPRGTAISLISSFAVPLGALVVLGEVPFAELVALSVTASLLAFVSPIQDHMRAVFHMSDISWMAAVTSAVNFTGTTVALVFLYRPAITWAVYGALFAGNVLSLLVGWLWVRSKRPQRPPRPTMRDLYAVGGWLLVTGLGKTGMRYALTASLSFFAGIAALGFIEAARVVSQPIRVFGQGIMTQVGPRLTEAGSRRDPAAGHRWMRRFLLLLGLVTVPYFAIMAIDWPLNPFLAIAPRAYEVPGLVAATILVVAAAAYADALRFPLLGARRQRAIAVITFVTGLVELAVTPTGLVVGAFAAPLSAVVALTMTVVWSWRLLREAYASPPEIVAGPADSGLLGGETLDE